VPPAQTFHRSCYEAAQAMMAAQRHAACEAPPDDEGAGRSRASRSILTSPTDYLPTLLLPALEGLLQGPRSAVPHSGQSRPQGAAASRPPPEKKGHRRVAADWRLVPPLGRRLQGHRSSVAHHHPWAAAIRSTPPSRPAAAPIHPFLSLRRRRHPASRLRSPGSLHRFASSTLLLRRAPTSSSDAPAEGHRHPTLTPPCGGEPAETPLGRAGTSCCARPLLLNSPLLSFCLPGRPQSPWRRKGADQLLREAVQAVSAPW